MLVQKHIEYLGNYLWAFATLKPQSTEGNPMWKFKQGINS